MNKKVWALILSIMMLFGLFPFSGYAVEIADVNGRVTSEERIAEDKNTKDMSVNEIVFINTLNDQKISYWMTRADIENSIGKSQEQSGFGEVYSGITIRYRNDLLAFLIIDSDSWVVNNVKVGSSVASLVEAFDLQELDGVLNYTIAYYGDNTGSIEPKLLVPFEEVRGDYLFALDFAVEDNVVTRIMFGDRDALVYMK